MQGTQRRSRRCRVYRSCDARCGKSPPSSTVVVLSVDQLQGRLVLLAQSDGKLLFLPLVPAVEGVCLDRKPSPNKYAPWRVYALI